MAAGWDEEKFVELLSKLIGDTEKLQNKPPHLVPQESLVGNHVEAALSPFLEQNGGPLKLERVEYMEGRNNVIITYPGTGDKVVSFIGSHMDVVPARSEEWDWDPFSLTRDGDKLYGRGTTDCLGHVALITQLFIHLATTKPELAVSIIGVFIANEENSMIEGVGVDALCQNGKLSHLKNGWGYWIDTADSQPCLGTASSIGWSITADGHMGHSGVPNKAINGLLLGYEAVIEMCNRFHADFPPHANEEKWKFANCSTMKMTTVDMPPGAINQIPAKCTIQGDIRLTPFYKVEDAKAAVEKYVKEINENITALPTRGPGFSYDIGTKRGSISFSWQGASMSGVAVDLESPGLKALSAATEAVQGTCTPFSLTGSLPLIAELKEEGFDLQMIGFGHSSVYHGTNEYVSLESMKKGYEVLSRIIDSLNKQASQ
eukprot:TRINITY_DN11337_c0_g1_i1.p2 TRINITY_DN11337_c0_g1~~TRINITY_DN11337_c0_g1_i1.p2  ORF type:complete len:443 (+),score=151.53 TRINITY_DN11337_c0_g1_i1:38-1330(+)